MSNDLNLSRGLLLSLTISDKNGHRKIINIKITDEVKYKNIAIPMAIDRLKNEIMSSLFSRDTTTPKITNWKALIQETIQDD